MFARSLHEATALFPAGWDGNIVYNDLMDDNEIRLTPSFVRKKGKYFHVCKKEYVVNGDPAVIDGDPKRVQVLRTFVSEERFRPAIGTDPELRTDFSAVDPKTFDTQRYVLVD